MKITETARAIQDFVDELSNWYVRLSKQRFWGKRMDGRQEGRVRHAVHCAGHALRSCARRTFRSWRNRCIRIWSSAISPAQRIPCICATSRAATSAESITELEASMEEVMDVVQLGRACRNAANIKVRQALGTLYVKGAELDSAFCRS